jgi:hypothetical protein
MFLRSLLSLCALWGASLYAAERPPNIVFIVVDDTD